MPCLDTHNYQGVAHVNSLQKRMQSSSVVGYVKRVPFSIGYSLHTSLVAHHAGAYPGFRSMKRLGVFLLLPGWDASPP